MIKKITARGIIACLCLIFTITIYSPVLAQEVVSAVEEPVLSFEEKQRAILENGVFVVNGFLMGAWDGKYWVDAESTFPYIPDYTNYQLYTIEADIKNNYAQTNQMTTTGCKYIDNSIRYIPGGNIKIDVIDNIPTLGIVDFIAARSVEPLKLLSFKKLHAGNPIYQEWTDEIVMTGQNPDVKLRVRDVYGDNEYNGEYGTFLIIADNGYQEDIHGEVIFIRKKTVEGDYKSLILRYGVFLYGPREVFYPSRLVFISDLNHDGENEFIVQVRSNGELPQMAYMVYTYHEGQYHEVLNGGWSE